MKKNKGAVSVLLSVIIFTMVIAIGAAGDVCSLAVAKAYAQRINYMACQSVLAEYDRELFEDYGLMGFQGGKDEIKDLVILYSSMMERINEGSGSELVFFNVVLEDISVDCSERNLYEKEVFIGQIREIMKYKAVETGAETLIDIIEGKGTFDYELTKAKASFGEKASFESGDGSAETVFNERSFDPEEKEGTRVLKSKRVIESLPSKSKEGNRSKDSCKYDLGKDDELLRLGEDSSGLLNGFYNAVSGGTDKLILIDYSDEFFKNAVKESEKFKETFFKNEMEYILKGDFSDSNNLTLVKRDLFLLRTALNIAHIYSDPEKRTLVAETAAASGAGPYTAALQFLLVVAWAGVEASEDIEKLFNGGKVPFKKDVQDWKTDMESVFSDEEKINDAYVGERGLDYTQYLKLFMLTCSKEKLTERIMDLIHINMKGRYDEDFDLRNHITGFNVSADHKREGFLPDVLPGIVEDELMHLEEEFAY